MADVRFAVRVFSPRSGTGTQDVTYADARGDFRPKLITFVSGFARANTLESVATAASCYAHDIGWHIVATGEAACTGVSESDQLGGVKVVNAMGGQRYSLGHTEAGIFGATLIRAAQVTSTASGRFTLTYDTNLANGDSVIAIIWGGADFEVSQTTLANATTYAQTFNPGALMVTGLTSMSATGGITSGNTQLMLGWATRADSGAAALNTYVQNQLANSRYQRTDKTAIQVDSSLAAAGEVNVASFTDSSVVTGSVTMSAHAVVMGGTNIRFRTVVFTQKATAGLQTVNAGVNRPRGIWLMSVGATASSSPASDMAQSVFGFADSTLAQASYWAGENTSGNVPPLHGARLLNTSTVLRFGTPAGASTTWLAEASLDSIDTTTGDIVLDWSSSDGVARQIVGFVMGDDGGVDPPVAYENPCTIQEPKIFAKVTTDDEILKFGVSPLRDSAALGGFAEPRLIDVSPVTKVASDVATGAWSAQTATMKWADTDRANRARSEARTSFRNCDAEIYITSNERRLAGLPPRSLFAGTILEDSADTNLVLSTTINDLIGANYSLFSEEKQIPQRVIERNWFPNAPDESLGQAEPIVGGRRAVLNPSDYTTDLGVPIEGVTKGVYIGQVRINGSHGTPTGTTLADIVAALNTSGAAGTIYVDWGYKIGYGDAVALQSYYDSNGTVPTDYDGLAHIIGYSDLDAWLAEEAHTGGDLFEAVVIAGHAISEILNAANAEPSIWIGDTQVPLADIGVSVWAPQIPGDTSWAADIGSDLFTDILGSDGTTRRYTLILFDPGSGHGTDVAGGAVVHVDCIGLEDEGDGTGAALTDYFDLYRHVLINFILQDYQSGGWLESPQFLFPDGVTPVDRVDSESFDAASTVAALTLPGGYLGSFTIGDRTSVRDIIARFNFSGGCLLAQDDFQRLIVRVLDTRRTEFLTGRFTTTPHRTLRDKVDILPGFTIDAKPEWQCNHLTYQYAHNEYSGAYERGASGGGNEVSVGDVTSQGRDGVIKKTVEFPYVADDATADTVANYYLQLFKDLPRVVTYARRGLCSLEDDLLDGVPITHFNGYGASGWSNHAVWIIGKTFDPKRMFCTFTALDVEARLVEAETPAPDPLMLDPVALEALVDDVSGDPLYADT